MIVASNQNHLLCLAHPLRLITFNVQGKALQERKFEKFRERKFKKLRDFFASHAYGVDVIMIQENVPELSLNNFKLSGEYKDWCRVAVPQHSEWTLVNAEHTTYAKKLFQDISPSDPHSTGYVCTRVTLQLRRRPHITINALNVHLCGGRFDDERVFKHIYHDCITNLQNFVRWRTKLFNDQMNTCDVDIIAGDFNGDMGYYATRQQATTLSTYCKDHKFDIFYINAWNLIPFLWLQANGFTSQAADQHTSYYENTPDAVWCSRRCHWMHQKVILQHKEENIVTNMSDHNALSAALNIESAPQSAQIFNEKTSTTLVLFLLALRGFNEKKIEFETALRQIKKGRKTSCWAWYFIPCKAIQRVSPQSQVYSVDDASAFLRVRDLHDALYRMMRAIANALRNDIPVTTLLPGDEDRLRACLKCFMPVAQGMYARLYSALEDVHRGLLTRAASRRRPRLA